MAKLVFGATLMFELVNVYVPLHAQQPTVSINVCNAGKVDIDVFLSQLGKVSSSHIGSADCATVAHTVGSMPPTYVGFAFADSQGQWGAVRRLELLPDLGLGILDRADQNAVVRHGNSNVSLPLLMSLKPRTPGCTTTTTTSSPSAVASLPLGASPAQVRAARAQDVGASPSSGSTTTTCDAFDYMLNVLTYPDSHEIRFNKFCDICDKKKLAQLTPEQRAAEERRLAQVNQVAGSLAGLGGIGGAVMGAALHQADQQAKEEQQQREKEKRQDRFQRIGWNDIPQFVNRAFRSPGLPDKNIVIQGTIAGFKLPLPGASVPWTEVYFKESPDKTFNFCTSSPDIFKDVFGQDFSTSLIGKTVQVEGEVTRAYCNSLGGIRVTLARQLHLVGSGAGMVAAVAAPAYTFPKLAPTPVPEPYLDPSMPSYDPQAKGQILQYCQGLYNPSASLPTEQNRIRYEERSAIAVEVQKCALNFDPAEVTAHRRIAMRYCLGHNDYTDRVHGDRMPAYDECMRQNDTLTALCSQELKYRAELNHMPNLADQKCPVPRPNGREALVILKGGHDDIGHPVVIPATGPGLPAIVLAPMEPGIIQRSMVNAANPAPAPVPSQPVQQAATRAALTTRSSPASAAPTAQPVSTQLASNRPAAAQAARPAATPADVDSIIELVKGGMSEALVIKTIQRQGKTYDLTPADLVKLQKAGVSEKIISALLDSAAASPAAPAQAAAPPSPAVSPGAKAAQEQQNQAQVNAAAQQQRQQQAADRQKQTQERAQTYNACRQQALKDHPGAGADLVKAFASCIQILQAK